MQAKKIIGFLNYDDYSWHMPDIFIPKSDITARKELCFHRELLGPSTHANSLIYTVTLVQNLQQC